MKIRNTGVLLLSLLLAGAAWSQEKRSVSTDANFTWQGSLAAGKTVTVEGLNGRVRAIYTPGDKVEVRAEKTARENGNLNEVWVEVFEHANGVTVCAIHGKDKPEPGKCSQEGRPRMNWNRGEPGRNVRLDFTVKVPKGVRFVGKSTNGGVEALDLQSVVHAETTNGGIKISTSEWASAETTNGAIEVAMGKVGWSEKLSLETTNGGIHVTLPESAALEVSAETTNGSVSTDFPLTMSGRLRRNHLRGTIGGGGHALDLETTNGSIRLSKGSAGI